MTRNEIDKAVETVREQIFEVFANSQEFTELVKQEMSARFPGGVPGESGDALYDEVQCLCTLEVYRAVFKGIC